MKNKKLRIVIIMFLISFVIFGILGNIIATVLYSFAQIKAVSFAPKYLFSKFSLLIGFLAASISTACLAVYFIKFRFYTDPKLINNNDRADSDLYGKDRLQTTEEIHQSYGFHDFEKLNETDHYGTVVNSEVVKDKNGTHLMLSLVPEQNALLIGTTGSGKSTYQLEMTIQANAKSKTKPSMVIMDPKGVIYKENHLALAAEGYKINVIDLNNPRTSGQYNPLHLIYKYYHIYHKTHEGKYLDLASLLINELALTLIPTGRSNDPKWEQGAQGVVSGTIWAMLEDSLVPEFEFDESKFTLAQLSNIVNKQKDNLSEFLTLREKTSPAPEQAAAIVGISSEKTVDGYLSTIGASLRNFLDEGIKYLTSKHNVDMDFITKPTATFIIIPDSQSSRDVVGSLLITQIYRSLIMESSNYPDDKLPRPTYFLIDEFGNLPKIDEFLKWISLCRSRRIFFEIIVQSFGQLRRIYGDTGIEEISSNCPLQLYLGSTDESTIEEFSKKFGTYTAYQHSRNVDIDKTGGQMHGGTSLVSRDVVRKEELRNIKMSQMYFKEFRKYGCKCSLVPIFDKRLKDIIIFKNNVPPKYDLSSIKEVVYKEDPINWNEHYYDIAQRNNIYNAAKEQSKKQEWDYGEFDYAGIDNLDLFDTDDNISNNDPDDSQRDYLDIINK